jgi:hypothetical protein
MKSTLGAGITAFGLVVCSLAFAARAEASVPCTFDLMTDADQAQVQRGEPAVHFVDDPSSAWPKIYIYQRIDASAEEAAAVYTDYELQHTYIPRLKKSHISKQLTARSAEVDFEVDIPLYPDERFTARNELSLDEPQRTYKIEWKLVRASSTKDSTGTACFKPYAGAALFAYYNFVVPGSSMAGIGVIKDHAKQQAQDTVQAIRKQVEKERAQDQDHLAKQVQALRSALGAALSSGENRSEEAESR